MPGQLDPDKYDFAVAHMFSNDDFGKVPGEIEVPEVIERTDEYGIHYLDFYVTGLSPIMVSWEDSAAIALNENAESENSSILTDIGETSDIHEEEPLSTQVKIKLAIAIAIGVIFTLLTLWIAKKIAWG